MGLTENPGALRRWMVAGPEVARMIDEFERSLPPTNGKANAHQEQVPSVKNAFATDVTAFLSAVKEVGNPFEDESADLFVLDTKDIVSTEVVDTVKNITHIGERQYNGFVKERLQERCKAVTEPLKKNKLPLFGTPVQKVTKQTGRLSALKNDCALFSRLYIACQCRDGDLEGFFEHKNQPWPPSLSQMGEMRQGQKADLVKCLESLEEGQPDAPAVDAKIIDGAVLVQMLSPGIAMTFQDYAASIFVPYVVNQLQSSKRVDIVWDVYQKDILKKATRQKRGSGLRRRVEASSKIPGNWNAFLRVDENKTELFRFLAKQVERTELDQGKELFSTFGDSVLSSASREDLSSTSPCSHEEADTRLLLHVLDAARSEHTRIAVITNDTDVLVLAVAMFQEIPVNELWVAFGVGKHQRYLKAHEISFQLGVENSKALSMFHAITGCDNVSFFAGRGKKTAWEVWKSFSSVTDAFLELISTPGSIHDHNFALIERFVMLMYDRTSGLHEVNQARQELFCQRSRKLEGIPPTRAALEQHVKHACYQAGHVWSQSLVAQPVLPSPSEWGWEKDGDCWRPHWTDLKEAKDTCYELIQCGCKKACRGRCKCLKASLKCTALCKCGGSCQ